MTDIKRATIIAFIQSIFPVLVIAGVANLTPDAIAAIMLLVSNGLTMAMLLFKKGQGS